MKIWSLFPDLLATFGGAASLEAGLSKTLSRLVTLTGARAGGLAFSASGAAACTVTAGRGLSPALERWLRDQLAKPVGRLKVSIPRGLPSGWDSPAVSC